MFNISEELKKLPEKPGVYIMKNKPGDIIYVGKAVNLKNRVRQYFQSLSGQTAKMCLMVSEIRSFEYIITASEMEALILECNLIKKHKPKYNILLKDDKNYPYIKVTVNEEYPRILITRKAERDGARYFGPYTSAGEVKKTVGLLKKVFPIRSCKQKLIACVGKTRPCLNYHIMQCLAPCAGYIDKEQYNKLVNDVCDFLGGKQDELLKKLKAEMIEASENMDFEKAASIRDKIALINNMFQGQRVLFLSFLEVDVVALAKKNDYACIQVFFVRGGKIIGRKNYLFSDIEEEEKELLGSFIKQFYNSSDFIPGEILIQEEIEDMNLIESWLGEKRGRKVRLKVPKRGEKLQLMDIASQNVAVYLENSLKTREREKKDWEDASRSLAELLKTDTTPSRIEAYDISSTGSTEITGSIVVFEGGKVSPGDYRRYKIKTLKGKGFDDYSAIQEMVTRRFSKGEEFLAFPDLILADGGIGHVNTVIKALKALNVQIPVLGMVKDEDHHTRGLISADGEYDLSANMPLLRFIASIQNEAHRFAVEYNRKLRNKRYRESILDKIPGIGSKRKRELVKYFGSIKRIMDAEIDELMAVEGISRKTAENIYNFFREAKTK